ncbi:hypothetical protein HOLleu_34118 [Holothuria leucospilota]|uniref:Uncharacterized protein n=1 Tax=Holothuria leucospilota TaxID=206669 RepID=A0A9Q0YU36_HOLLE|nr:hypothetical protein HOLleu_34118 [Holothuria leucospilota]
MNFPSVTGKAAVALLLIVIFSVACQAHNTYSMKGKYRWRAGKRSYNFRDSLEKKMPSYSNMFQGIQQYPLQYIKERSNLLVDYAGLWQKTYYAMKIASGKIGKYIRLKKGMNGRKEGKEEGKVKKEKRELEKEEERTKKRTEGRENQRLAIFQL